MDIDDFCHIDSATMLANCARFNYDGDLTDAHATLGERWDAINRSVVDYTNSPFSGDMFLADDGAGKQTPIQYLGEMSERHWTRAQRMETAQCVRAGVDAAEVNHAAATIIEESSLDATAKKTSDAILRDVLMTAISLGNDTGEDATESENLGVEGITFVLLKTPTAQYLSDNPTMLLRDGIKPDTIYGIWPSQETQGAFTARMKKVYLDIETAIANGHENNAPHFMFKTGNAAITTWWLKNSTGAIDVSATDGMGLAPEAWGNYPTQKMPKAVQGAVDVIGKAFKAVVGTIPTFIEQQWSAKESEWEYDANVGSVLVSHLVLDWHPQLYTVASDSLVFYNLIQRFTSPGTEASGPDIEQPFIFEEWTPAMEQWWNHAIASEMAEYMLPVGSMASEVSARNRKHWEPKLTPRQRAGIYTLYTSGRTRFAVGEFSALMDQWRSAGSAARAVAPSLHHTRSDSRVSPAYLRANAEAFAYMGLRTGRFDVQKPMTDSNRVGDLIDSYAHASAHMSSSKGNLLHSMLRAAKLQDTAEPMHLDSFDPAGARYGVSYGSAPMAPLGMRRPAGVPDTPAILDGFNKLHDGAGDVAGKLAAAALMLARPTRQTFQNWIERDIPLPCTFMLCRPWRRYEMGAGILAKGGLSLGASLYGNINFQCPPPPPTPLSTLTPPQSRTTCSRRHTSRILVSAPVPPPRPRVCTKY
jgi:hypothetical protein